MRIFIYSIVPISANILALFSSNVNIILHFCLDSTNSSIKLYEKDTTAYVFQLVKIRLYL